MAKPKITPAAAGPAGEPPSDSGAGTAGTEALTADAGAVVSDEALSASDPDSAPDDDSEGDQKGEEVAALVLHSSHLGKVGEKIKVPAALAQELKDAGYIDTHPAALKYKG
ncbi:hypothetical protein GGR77_001515 [Xanthomonas translucens]